MQVVDRIASSGYSYVSPTVDRACNVVPLLGGIKQRIEPYAPPLIKKADMCVDTVYGVVEVRATALRGVVNSAGNKALYLKEAAYSVVEDRATALCDVVTSTGGKAQRMIGENVVVLRVHKTSLAIVDTLDMLIDHYLPEPESKEGKENEAQDSAPKNLIPRMLHIPFKIPIRMIHISIAKTHDGYDAVQLRIHWARQLTSDQKAKLASFLLSQSQAIADKVSCSSLAVTLQQGREGASKKLQVALQSFDDGKGAAREKCYSACERLHVFETKDWALNAVGSLQQASVDRASQIFVVGSHRVYDATSFVLGQDRAMGIFTFVNARMPFVKLAVHSSASTGALSDSTSHEAEEQNEPSTGTTGTVAVSPSTLSTDEGEQVESFKEQSVVVKPQASDSAKVLQEVAEVQQDSQKEDVQTAPQTIETNKKAKKSIWSGFKKKRNQEA